MPKFITRKLRLYEKKKKRIKYKISNLFAFNFYIFIFKKKKVVIKYVCFVYK